MVWKLGGGVFAADREYRQRLVELLLVEAGEGIAILPSNLQQRGTSELAFCPLRPPGASIEAGAGLVAGAAGSPPDGVSGACQGGAEAHYGALAAASARFLTISKEVPITGFSKMGYLQDWRQPFPAADDGSRQP
jgi:hypothetical protein